MRFRRSDFARVAKNPAVGALLERGHSAANEQRKKARKQGDSLCDIYINLWLLTHEGLRSKCWNVERPLPNFNTGQVTAANACSPCSLLEALPEGNF